ncbi:ATP-binding protein [Chryseobacterium sp. FH1]|uniref:ATP-binding protein n=1 Tax=Chryseobacterium sp. FH1 TaxID=1233951 RepID=UPI0004E35061|nr:ATP-binding protein [Chryseobacterium sp. FH1]KFC19576.1 histidine kinase [Chryseobacterium sp. FH1]
MKIKTKLNAGVGLLFLMIIVLSVLSGWYINQLKKDTNNILVANYNTLQYSRNMLLALEEIHSNSSAFTMFERHLDKQKKNVTEPGEKEATENIATHFLLLKERSNNPELLSSIRKDIAELMQLNMIAIEHKSSVAESTAKSAIMAISVTGMLCFIIAFILMVNLPSNIANPIQILTGSIKQIADQNYKERVHFESKSEFGELAMSFNIMAEKLQEYSESKLDKIIRGKRRIETLIDNMHDPVIGIDEGKKVLFVNDAALKVTGLKKEFIVGKQIQDVAVTNDLVRKLIKEPTQPDTSVRNEEAMKIYADGKESYFEKEIIDINVIPTGEKESQFIGQVIMLRNITPFKELDLSKTNFLGTVSHEFKTPIASIQMGLQLLENKQVGSLNDEQGDLIAGIKQDSDRLLKITGELLNMTQLESGSIELHKRATEIKSIIDYAVNANRSAATEKLIQIRVQIQEGLSTVYADTEKTSWVLNNLLSNAIRYSHENSEIEVDVLNDVDKVWFLVRDHGRGIEEQFIDKVFDRYFRIPGTAKGGTGLGLSISKQFVEAMGGKLTVKSNFGSGSEFIFYMEKYQN